LTPSTTQMICGEATGPATKIAPSGPCATVKPVSAAENAPLIVTSAKIFSGPVGPGVGKAFELDAAGSGVGSVEPDPAAADALDDAAVADASAERSLDVCEDDCEDDSADDPATGALTDVVTGPEGPPECEAMQPVLTRASAATAQPFARARRRSKVSIGTDPGTAPARS